MWKPRPRCFASLAERRDLGGAIDEAIFGRIGDRQRGRLDLVDVLADAVARRRRRRPASTFAPGPSSSISLAPPVKKPGAPASSTSICASRWQRIAP